MSHASLPPAAAPVDADPDGRRPVRRALVSVYDKTGLADLATALHAAGVEIVSTGSTAATMRAAVEPVETSSTPASCRAVASSARPVLS